MVKAHHLDAGDRLDHLLQERIRRFDQVGPYLLEQVPSLLGRDIGKLLFGGCQQALETNDDEIAEQVGVNIRRRRIEPRLFGRMNKERC